jgi:DNA-binding NtrC family response regulator
LRLYPDEIRERISHVQIKLLRVLETLQTTNGRKSKAAKMFGISTRKIEYKIKEWLKKWWF